jgi:hypothetical protein
VITARLLSAWEGLVGSVALLAIIVLALCVMVSVVKPGDVPRHLGGIVGVVILLIMLPAIIVSLWNGMSLGQHLGIVAISIAVLAVFGASRHASRSLRRK